MKIHSESRLPALLWLVFPCVMMLCQIAIEVFVPQQHLAPLHGEAGPHEAVEALIIVLAFFAALWIFLKVQKPWLKAWVGLAAICCFYVAGEELSWGQHIFNWTTPEYWENYNDQGETNLHNTSSWLDQKPRALLEIGVLVGGLIIPALQKWNPLVLPKKFSEIYPDWQLSVTAGFAVVVKLCDFIQKQTGAHLFYRSSEVLELYLYYFVLLYLIGRGMVWARQGKIKVSD